MILNWAFTLLVFVIPSICFHCNKKNQILHIKMNNQEYFNDCARKFKNDVDNNVPIDIVVCKFLRKQKLKSLQINVV